MPSFLRTRGVWAYWALAAVPAALAVATAQPPGLADRPPFVQIYRGENSWLGRYDADGNFIRDANYPANYAKFGGSGLPPIMLGTMMNKFTSSYEHRSGRLIRGTVVKSGAFVPDIGSTVLDLKNDYDPKTSDRLAWNLPESWAAFWTEGRKKQFPRGLPQTTEPPATGTPSGWEFTPFSKSHPKKPPKHARVISDAVEFGHLSDEGEFVPDPDLPVVSRKGILGPLSSDAEAVPRFYTIPKLDPRRKELSIPTYEYRSGRLIRGDLHERGNFVPELGSKVIDFKDFDPEKEPRRWIYNLPGTLKKKPE